MTHKKFTIQPHWATHFWWYLAGLILLPLFGIGIYIIYKKSVELSKTFFEIRNQSISVITPEYTENMDLDGIRSAETETRWIDKRFSIGTVSLKSDNRELKLHGVKQPRELSSMILQAAEAERKRLEELNTIQQKPDTPQPGNLEKMDYLTGLWQQGLLSDEDFKKEKKYFEG